MNHPTTSIPAVRVLATVVATLLGQALADGLDRAPILPKTHAAPSPPLWPSGPSALLPTDLALLAAFSAQARLGVPDIERERLEGSLRAVLGGTARAPRDVHPDERSPTLASDAGGRARAP